MQCSIIYSEWEIYICNKGSNCCEIDEKGGDGSQFFSREELEENLDNFCLVERTDDYSATAYWYMDTPLSTLPEILPYMERVKDLV